MAENYTMLILRKLQLEEQHKVLMELWDDKSKAKIHLKISKMLDQCIEELEQLKSQMK